MSTIRSNAFAAFLVASAVAGMALAVLSATPVAEVFLTACPAAQAVVEPLFSPPVGLAAGNPNEAGEGQVVAPWVLVVGDGAETGTRPDGAAPVEGRLTLRVEEEPKPGAVVPQGEAGSPPRLKS